MRKQQGFTLIEILIAMTILGIVSVGFLSALTTSSRASIATDQMDSGRVIAQAQMEWVKSQKYLSAGNYTLNDSLMTQYPGYSVAITALAAAQRDTNIQKVTITVTHNGKVVATLQDCKTKR
jgi:prepilin-type N-terminal cleavage/methylation domain-containing protein